MACFKAKTPHQFLVEAKVRHVWHYAEILKVFRGHYLRCWTALENDNNSQAQDCVYERGIEHPQTDSNMTLVVISVRTVQAA